MVDQTHSQQLRKTNFFGKQGAGCLFIADDSIRLLIAHRSKKVQEPGTWGTWGGAIDDGEAPKEAVVREAREEAGVTISLSSIVPMYVFQSGTFKYHNFLVHVPEEFTPKLNWETQSFLWVDYGDWPSPLHPGMKTWLTYGVDKLREEVMSTLKIAMLKLVKK